MHAVAADAGRRECRVVRPDGAALVGERVVAAMRGGERPQPPAAEEVRLQQAARDRLPSLERRQADPEQVRRVGADARDRALAGVQRERVETLLRQPELLLDERPKLERLGAQPLGRHVLSGRIEELRQRQTSGVEVPL